MRDRGTRRDLEQRGGVGRIDRNGKARPCAKPVLSSVEGNLALPFALIPSKADRMSCHSERLRTTLDFRSTHLSEESGPPAHPSLPA